MTSSDTESCWPIAGAAQMVVGEHDHLAELERLKDQMLEQKVPGLAELAFSQAVGMA